MTQFAILTLYSWFVIIKSENYLLKMQHKTKRIISGQPEVQNEHKHIDYLSCQLIANHCKLRPVWRSTRYINIFSNLDRALLHSPHIHINTNKHIHKHLVWSFTLKYIIIHAFQPHSQTMPAVFARLA